MAVQDRLEEAILMDDFDTIREMLDSGVISEFDVDEDRVYLTGLSMGGYGTWFTAMARPDLFAAIAPICGGGMAYNADVLKMPVWAFCFVILNGVERSEESR